MIADTTAHKLATAIGFIRAIDSGQTNKAQTRANKYERLNPPNWLGNLPTSDWFGSIKKHAVELMHEDVGERVRELKKVKASLPQSIYERKMEFSGVSNPCYQLVARMKSTL